MKTVKYLFITALAVCLTACNYDIQPDKLYLDENGVKELTADGKIYDLDEFLDKFIPKLREASARRLAASKEWKTHIENVNWQKKTAADNIHPVSFPDAKARREKQARIAAEMNRMNRARSRSAAKEPWKKGVDPVRDEALNILADLVELNGGRRLPAAAPSADSSALFDSLDDE